MKPRRRRSCIVIGAGLAGLSAAHRLTSRGWAVDVLEAQDRLGGRVLSWRFDRAPHLVCELGAEWIGADHHRLRRLCRELGLPPLERHQYSFTFWNAGGHARRRTFRPGGWSFSKRAHAGFRSLERKYKRYDERQQRELDQCDWWTTLRDHGFSMNELAARDLMDSTDFGESIRLSSAYLAATEYFAGNGTDEMDFKIAGGNDRLVEALARRVQARNAIRTGSLVKRVEQGPDGVDVYVKDDRTPFRAQFCICTVPAHCLLGIRWKPALARDQQDAAKQLQYSRIMKTAVLYEDRFWPAYKRSGFSVFTSRASDFCFDSTFRQPGPHGILCSYAIGDKADDLASETNVNNVMKWITEDVVKAVGPAPDCIIAPIDVRSQPWQRQEWIGGAYAFYRPGQWFSVRPALARPHGRVMFAGEHLSEEWQGFMEGAVETGQRAADALVTFAS